MKTIVTAAALLLFSTAAVQARADQWNKQYTVNAKPEIHVVTDDGNVRVRPGENGRVSAEVMTRGWKIGPDEVRIEEHQTGNRIDLEVRTPRGHWFGSHSLRIDLTVPAESALNVETKDGNVTAEGIRGETDIKTGDGNVDVSSLDGALRARTGDGNVRVTGRFDQLELQTGDGNIDADIGGASKMTSEWRLSTGDGNLTLNLPENFAADLDAHTGDGKITLDLPVTTSGSFSTNTLRGKINGGGATLELRTGDGDIHLRRS